MVIGMVWLRYMMTKQDSDINQWQIDEISKAIKEADAGDFATDAEVQAVIEKWTTSQLPVNQIKE